ncbi:MAG: IclR family transcriptional regulator [Pseudomonadota bacterium]
MSSASKTLELLDYFSPTRPEIGLSQLCVMARRDKATTYRHLQSLEETGLVEQNPMTRRYRLGPALLQLARTREVTVPRKNGAEAPLRALADATGETSHVSVMSGKTLYNLMSCESPRHSIRVIIDIPTFPLHATASGLCALAFGREDLFEAATERLAAFTPKTIASIDALHASVSSARETGFGKTMGSFEIDVHSLAVPVFDQSGLLAGSVAVASVATRFTPNLEHIVRTHLAKASRDISHNWGGTVPANVEQAWAKTLKRCQELETTS